MKYLIFVHPILTKMIKFQSFKHIVLAVIVIGYLFFTGCAKDDRPGPEYFEEFTQYLDGNWAPYSVIECDEDVSGQFKDFILQIQYDGFSNKDNDQTFECQINQNNDYLPDNFSITLSPLTYNCKDNKLIFTTSNGYFLTITDNKNNFGSGELEFEIDIFCNLFKSPGKYKWRSTKLN